MKTILIVEDDHYYCKMLKDLSMEHGLDCITASNLQEALKIDFKRINAAIIDVMLPNDPDQSGVSLEDTKGNYISGVVLCRAIIKNNPTFPIILFSSDFFGSEAKQWAQDMNILYISKTEGPKRIINSLKKFNLLKENLPRSFIVHGHDEDILLELKNYIQNTLKWEEPIILREQKKCGRTIIEKFEECASNIDYVFVLLTPDDNIVKPDSSNTVKRRARQNVIFELGFFYGQYGRKSGRILALHQGPLDLPSDISGVIWIDISDGIDTAGKKIKKELGIE